MPLGTIRNHKAVRKHMMVGQKYFMGERDTYKFRGKETME